MNKPLVSIIILSYKNYHYLYEALDSTIKQDYQNIELIISNDGSEDFIEPEIRKYFKTNKRNNLKNLIIINNKHNLGTVKSLNNAIRRSNGKYILFFAADDAFYDNKVVSKFIKSFDTLPSSEYIVTSQLGMYDLELNNLIQLFINKNNIKFLKVATPAELFNRMATKCLIAAAGTCYKKELFIEHGYFDERYKLVEDYSSALKFSRLGIKFNYFDFISFKHRDGGISHGNVAGEKKLNKVYDQDILNIMKYEILPHTDLLDESQHKKFIKMYKDLKWRFKYDYYFIKASKAQKRIFIIKNWKIMLYGLHKDLMQYLVDQLVGKKLKVLLFGLFLLTVYLLNYEFLINNLGEISQVIKYSAWFLIVQPLIFTLYQIYKLCGSRLINIFKFII